MLSLNDSIKPSSRLGKNKTITEKKGITPRTSEKLNKALRIKYTTGFTLSRIIWIESGDHTME